MTAPTSPPPSDPPEARIRLHALRADGPLVVQDGAAVERLPALLAEPDSFVWVDLDRPSPAQVEAVGIAARLHPLIVEDVLEGDQRAKIETTDGDVLIVLFALRRDAATGFAAVEVSIVIRDGFLMTVHDGSWDPFASHHLQRGVDVVLRGGAGHLLWAISDDIVDRYFPVLDAIGDEIDAIQDAVVGGATPETLERLFDLKRQLIRMRRAVGPIREVFNQLTDRDTPGIDPAELVYLRDVYDHVIRLTDELDSFRELAAATLDVYLTQVNNDLSRIMKRLTGVTVLLAGVGAIAGLFGMSEARVEAGSFWLVTAGIVGLAGAALVALRRIGWI
ncbi:MAG: magnesium transporter CorA family protein [Candidatus Limnocylindria bacterium]